MATLSIRNLSDHLKHRLRIRAATNGRSMEEEVRCILREVLDPATITPDGRQGEHEPGREA